MSRNLNKMHPFLRNRFDVFKVKMEAKGLSFVITSIERTILEQMALFVQGRLPVQDVNMYRMVAGLPRIPESENRVVTWTLDSKHVVNYYDKDLSNDYSLAFDIALMKHERPHWDVKVNLNDNEIPDYLEAAYIGKECGLIPGGLWKHPDYPHFEIELPKASGILNITPA